MIAKLVESVFVLRRNFFLLAAIVLTVWLPGNLLLNYLLYFGNEEFDVLMVMRVTSLIDGVFGPLYAGAIIHTLACDKLSQPTDYGRAMSEGFSNWGSLFAARLIAGLLVLLGLLALIVPGVVLAVRYGFIDEAVVLEGKPADGSRKRSTELTEGVRWELLGVWIVSMVGVMVCSIVIYLPLGIAQEMLEADAMSLMLSETAADCLLDILYLIPGIATFLYYWQQREAEALTGPEALNTRSPKAEAD